LSTTDNQPAQAQHPSKDIFIYSLLLPAIKTLDGGVSISIYIHLIYIAIYA
jgi:hypothetical protein